MNESFQKVSDRIYMNGSKKWAVNTTAISDHGTASDQRGYNYARISGGVSILKENCTISHGCEDLPRAFIVMACSPGLVEVSKTPYNPIILRNLAL